MTPRHICRDIGAQTLPPSQTRGFFGFLTSTFH